MNGTDIFPVATILFYLFQMQLSVQLEKNVGRVHISPDTCPAHQTETSAASGFQGEWITTELYSSECGSPQNRSRVAQLYALYSLSHNNACLDPHPGLHLRRLYSSGRHSLDPLDVIQG